jgi:hypothetical protein
MSSRSIISTYTLILYVCVCVYVCVCLYLYMNRSHDLEISTGTVYNALYLTVYPTGSQHWNEMMQWMIDSFGPTAQDGVWTANQRWYANNARFWFRDSRDLTLFILRWS